jgi:hypothetical protein
VRGAAGHARPGAAPAYRALLRSVRGSELRGWGTGRRATHRDAVLRGPLLHPSGLCWLLPTACIITTTCVTTARVSQGGTLQDRIQRGKRAAEACSSSAGTDVIGGDGAAQPLGAEEALRLFAQLSLAVQLLHTAGILHRDLKAENIFMTHSGDCQLGDFGLSKELGVGGLTTTTVGTPHHLSPELVSGRPYGAMSDVWALGCIAHELSTLEYAFEGDSLPQIVMAVMKPDDGSTRARWMRLLRRRGTSTELTAEFDRIIGGCLARAPAERTVLAELLAEDEFLGVAAAAVEPLSERRSRLARAAAAVGGLQWVGEESAGGKDEDVIELDGADAETKLFLAASVDVVAEARRQEELPVRPLVFDCLIYPPYTCHMPCAPLVQALTKTAGRRARHFRRSSPPGLAAALDSATRQRRWAHRLARGPRRSPSSSSSSSGGHRRTAVSGSLRCSATAWMSQQRLQHCRRTASMAARCPAWHMDRRQVRPNRRDMM